MYAAFIPLCLRYFLNRMVKKSPRIAAAFQKGMNPYETRYEKMGV